MFIAIPKKPDTVECKEHRKIALIGQLGKVILRVIGRRIKMNITENADKSGFCFRKGKNTTNVIFILRIFIERAIEMEKTSTCFIQISRRPLMMEMLQDVGVHRKYIPIKRNLYYKRKATVQVREKNTLPSGAPLRPFSHSHTRWSLASTSGHHHTAHSVRVLGLL